MRSKIVNITAYTPYKDDYVGDDTLFNIYVDTRLVLLGDDQLSNDVIAMDGQLRNRGLLEVDGVQLDDSVQFVNAFILNETGDLSIGASVDDVVVVRNTAEATWEFNNSAEVTQTGANSRFVNLGEIYIPPSADTPLTGYTNSITFNANFYNHGSIDIDGEFFAEGEITRLFGRISGAGDFGATSAVLIDLNISVLSFNVQHDDRLIGNVVTTSKQLLLHNAFLAGASLTIFGNTDDDYVDLDSVKGHGIITVSGTETIDSFGAPDVSQRMALSAQVEVLNVGTLTRVGGIEIIGDSSNGSASQITNSAGAVWQDISADSEYVDVGGTNAGFDNAGTYNELRTGVFSMSVINDGVFDLGPMWEQGKYSTLTFNAPISGAGRIEVSAGEISIGAAISSGQSLEFVGATDDGSRTLEISDPAEFAATIFGFDQNGVTDDALIVNAAGWQFQDFAANIAGTGGSLILANGTAQTSLQLTGNYDATKFHAAVSEGQTTITYG